MGALSGALLLVGLAQSGFEVDLAGWPSPWEAWGANVGGRLGADLRLADLNGDGVVDLVLEETQVPIRPGIKGSRVCIYFGPLSLPSTHDLLAETPPSCILLEETGAAPTLAVGDLDGDGISDILITSQTTPASLPVGKGGAVLVFRGRRSWPSALVTGDADWTFLGANPKDALAFAGSGDLNGDGRTDLVLFAVGAGVPGRTGAGEGYVFFGPPSRWGKTVLDLAADSPDVHILGCNPADAITSSEPVIADIIGDTTMDLVFSANGDGPDELRPDAGEVYVLRGRSAWPAEVDLCDRTKVDLMVFGPQPSGGLVWFAVGDWDGDGASDLLVAASGYDPGGRPGAGAVFVLPGPLPSGTWDLLFSPAPGAIIGPRAGSTLGTRMRLRDVTGDGYADLVVSAPGDNTPWARTQAGAVFVISGCEGFAAIRDLEVQSADVAIYGIDGVTITNTLGDAYGSGLDVADIDDDGRADVMGGAANGDSVANGRDRAGEIELVLGLAAGTPVCSIIADAGKDVSECVGNPVTLDGSASAVTLCSKAPQFRWLLGATVIRDWTSDPKALVSPVTSETYRLEVRCGDCKGPCSASATVAVTVDPDLTPADLGNSLRARKATGDVVIDWATDPLARTYALHRETVKDALGPPFQPGLSGPTTTLPDVSPPPTLYFYKAAGASCSGREGP